MCFIQIFRLLLRPLKLLTLMKKLLLFGFLLLTVLVTAIYIFIPAQLHISQFISIGVSKNGAERVLRDEQKLKTALGIANGNNKVLVYNNDTLLVTENLYNAIKLSLNTSPTLLHFVNIRKDSTAFQWDADLNAGNSPISRVMAYKKALGIKKSMVGILGQLQHFLEQKEHIYGINISRVSTKDTLLVSTKKNFSSKPTTPQIFDLINTVQQFITSKGGIKNGNPIYHISKNADNNYGLMVAVPTNKILANEASFSFIRMIPGSFMTTEVTGGEYSVDLAKEKMQQYFTDYGHVSMAIDFNMLVTDRMRETDTSKWVTRIYLPVY